MACSSFTECVTDPLEGLGAAKTFESLGSTAVFSMNLALYIFYVLLLASVTWFLFKGIYAIIGADSSDAYEKFRGAITNSVFAAIGLVLLFSARFIFVQALILIGVPEAENIFMEGPLNDLLGI